MKNTILRQVCINWTWQMDQKLKFDNIGGMGSDTKPNLSKNE